MKSHANVMLLGQTGAGKSTLLNYLAGSDLCRTGVGMPVTQGFEDHMVAGKGRMPLRLIDSKGLEIREYRSIRADIQDYVRERCGGDISEWTHVILYCINAGSGRLQPAEAEFIRSLCQDFAQSVHIVLTHCVRTEDGQLNDAGARLVSHIREKLAEQQVRVYCVNSAETRTRATRCPAFGREEVLDGIFQALWADISRQLAADYARVLSAGMFRLYHQICWGIEAGIDKVCTTPFARMLSGNLEPLQEDLRATEERCQEKMGGILSELQVEYTDRMQNLWYFCSQHGIALRENLSGLEPAVCLQAGVVFALDEATFAQTAVGRFLTDLAVGDEDDFWQLLGRTLKGVGGMLGYRQIFRETGRDLKRILRRRMPGPETIAERIYAELLEAAGPFAGQSEPGTEAEPDPAAEGMGLPADNGSAGCGSLRPAEQRTNKSRR